MGLLKKNKKPQESSERVRYYHSKYDRYSKAIGVMWAILLVCFLIITLVCLIQPTWLGSANDAPGIGYFGLWNYYILDRDTNNQQVRGYFLDFGSIPSAAFQAATVFVGLTVLLTIICVLCLFLFCCISSRIVFLICGWILVFDGNYQSLVLSAIFLFLACVIYPAGWDAPPVVAMCDSSPYNANKCYILWAYILAIIAIFDAIILAILAFVLAFKKVKLLPWQRKDGDGGKAYIIDDRDRAPSEVQYVQTIQPVPAGQPVILVDQRSDGTLQRGTLKSQKSSRHNFHL